MKKLTSVHGTAVAVVIAALATMALVLAAPATTQPAAAAPAAKISPGLKPTPGPTLGPAIPDCPKPIGGEGTVYELDPLPQLPFEPVAQQVSTPTSDYSGTALDVAESELWVADRKANVIHIYGATSFDLHRTLDVSTVTDAVTGLSSLGQGRFALVDEVDGQVHVVSEKSGQNVVSVEYSFDTCLPVEADGDGLEGIAFSAPIPGSGFEAFVVAWDGSGDDAPALYKFRRWEDGSVDRQGPLTLKIGGDPVRGVHENPAGQIYVMSGRTIAELPEFGPGILTGYAGVEATLPTGVVFDPTTTSLWVAGWQNEVLTHQ